jgi:quinol monooxygenase YgiN
MDGTVTVTKTSSLLKEEDNVSITVLVEWQVKPDEMMTAKTLLKETFASTLHYGGCQRYEVYENQDIPGVLILLSRWDSRDRYARYMNWRKETGILDRFGRTFASPPKVQYLELISA